MISAEDWKMVLNKATSGDTKAMNEVAFWLKNGVISDGQTIIAADINESFKWTKKASDLGDLEATEDYAHYLTDRENVVCEPNIELGMQLYQKCYDNGSTYAAYCLGLEYRNKQQFDKAFDFYSKAETNEDFYQDLTTALCYYYGVGVTKKKAEALNRLLSINKKMCSEYEVDEAHYLIGTIYLEGEAVPLDLEKARYYLELADKDGDHRSAQELLIILGRKESLHRS